MNEIYNKNGTWHFDDYFHFLENNSQKIPLGIKSIVLDPNRYVFNTKETLHDSWLISMNYNIDINMEISNCFLKLLSPFHDKIYEYQFYDIQKIKFPKKPICKQDLLIHQFRFYKLYFQYEFLFSNGEKINVVF